MAWIYEGIGAYDQALTVVTKSLAIFRELHDNYRVAQALYDIGVYAMRMGRWQLAQSHFQEAIQIYEMLNIQSRLALPPLGSGSSPSYARCRRRKRGCISPRLQDYANPRTWRTGFDARHPFPNRLSSPDAGPLGHGAGRVRPCDELAQQLHNQYSATFIHYRRGNVFERQGRLDEAFAAYAQAIEGIEALRGATETEEIKIGLLGTAQQVYESMVLLCLMLDRPAEAFHYVERARSRAFLDMLAKKQSQADPTLYDALAQPVATLAEVQSQLREDALLLEYFTIGVLPRGESLINQLPAENTRLREHLTLPPQTIIFAITRDRLEIFRPPLDPNTLRPQPGDPGPGRRLLRDRLLTHLHTQLIAPAAALLHGRALLYLIPHGPLHYVPFMALRSAAGAHLLDAAGPAIALAPSATVLLRNCLGRPSAGRPRRAAAGAGLQ